MCALLSLLKRSIGPRGHMHSSFKSLIRPLYVKVWKTWERLTDRPTGRYPVAHQGIQRSGTNYLAAILMDADYLLLNRIDPKRDDPRHKHFRWQKDKSTIKMDQRYANDMHASRVAEVNRHANWPEGTRHVVLFRDPRDWLDGIFRWGCANNWFASEEAFVYKGMHTTFLREWDAYYTHWAELAQRDPTEVMIVRYANLRRDPGGEIHKIDLYSGVTREKPGDFSGQKMKVRHSKPLDVQRQKLSSPEIDELFCSPTTFDWQAYQLEGDST